jgi:hypothetical protein
VRERSTAQHDHEIGKIHDPRTPHQKHMQGIRDEPKYPKKEEYALVLFPSKEFLIVSLQKEE